ncbi:hypothetical protein [Candidatus Venteria ishoeyi]|uniref:HicB-like antitoxin of toxin-antitoxin system domain-containing protein n=1 Tax=Candidatus Venteria ishoeyi TaxID=1899563 RepID=A0A1H6FAX5_9GAMM|nr:hypothetical protein [Candidatus Venteria ishoeyi]SEH06184.1 Uncharacterised protein [Candidatus Venteria ishoeyi]
MRGLYEILLYWNKNLKVFIAEIPALGAKVDGLTYEEALKKAESHIYHQMHGRFC